MIWGGFCLVFIRQLLVTPNTRIWSIICDWLNFLFVNYVVFFFLSVAGTRTEKGRHIFCDNAWPLHWDVHWWHRCLHRYDIAISSSAGEFHFGLIYCGRSFISQHILPLAFLNKVEILDCFISCISINVVKFVSKFVRKAPTSMTRCEEAWTLQRWWRCWTHQKPASS